MISEKLQLRNNMIKEQCSKLIGTIKKRNCKHSKKLMDSILKSKLCKHLKELQIKAAATLIEAEVDDTQTAGLPASNANEPVIPASKDKILSSPQMVNGKYQFSFTLKDNKYFVYFERLKDVPGKYIGHFSKFSATTNTRGLSQFGDKNLYNDLADMIVQATLKFTKIQPSATQIHFVAGTGEEKLPSSYIPYLRKALYKFENDLVVSKSPFKFQPTDSSVGNELFRLVRGAGSNVSVQTALNKIK